MSDTNEILKKEIQGIAVIAVFMLLLSSSLYCAVLAPTGGAIALFYCENLFYKFHILLLFI